MAEEKPKDKGDAGGAAVDKDGDEGKAPKQSPMFKFLVIGTIVVVLLIIIAGVVWYVTKSMQTPYEADERQAKKEEKRVTPVLMTYMLGKDFKMVIRDRGETHNVKLIAYLAYSPEYADLAGELTAREPQLREVFYRVMGTKTVEEISYDRLDRLEDELLALINEKLEGGSISDIYWSEYIIQ